jgi:hypothetical protein
MSFPEDEIVAVLTLDNQYAYHINQLASVGTENLRVLRRNFSASAPYKFELVPLASCVRVEYKSGLAPFRIVAGVLLVTLMLAIFYFMGVYWDDLPPGMTIKVGLLGMALVYGLKWAFMSRRHVLALHLQDGTSIRWQSRSGDFKYKQRAVDKILDFLRARGLPGAAPTPA